MIAGAMKIVSWNVNGIRSCGRKGFGSWLEGSDAFAIGLQEVRANVDDIPDDLRTPPSWHTHFVAAERAGYSGVGLYAKQAPDEIITAFGKHEFDSEGRMQLVRFGKLWLANVYFPNGGGKERDNSRIPYKLDFKKELFNWAKPLVEGGERVLVMGDFNVAHEEIDIARPKTNRNTAGFTDVERAEMTRWLAGGWTDTFRHFEKGPNHYSWWSNRPGIREKNVGWRIDYVLASPGAMKFVKGAKIHPEVMGSDHCPVSVTLDPAVLK